jgi:response regulator of citrate/malate metabolism
MRQQNFLPTVLIIDDDVAVTSYLRERFHEETPLGALTANTMRDAKTLLESEDLPIHVVIADLFFQTQHRDSENNLTDGIDILKLAKDKRPDVDQYVFSVWSRRDMEQRKAKELGLDVKEWFHKMFFDASLQEKTPWRQISREQLTKELKNSDRLCERFKEKGLKADDNLEEIAALFNETTTPKTTFLQALNDDGYILKKPIRVRWSVEDDEDFVVKDMIGLLTEGVGETLDEALDDLAEQLVSEKRMLDEESENLQGLARVIKENLDSYIVPSDFDSY